MTKHKYNHFSRRRTSYRFPLTFCILELHLIIVKSTLFSFTKGTARTRGVLNVYKLKQMHC